MRHVIAHVCILALRIASLSCATHLERNKQDAQGARYMRDSHDSSVSRDRYYELDVRKLNAYWHHFALVTLLKLKAKTHLNGASCEDQIIYGVCAREARTAVAHARCVVALIDATSRAAYADVKHEVNVERDDTLSNVKRFWRQYFAPHSSTISSAAAFVAAPPPAVAQVQNRSEAIKNLVGKILLKKLRRPIAAATDNNANLQLMQAKSPNNDNNDGNDLRLIRIKSANTNGNDLRFIRHLTRLPAKKNRFIRNVFKRAASTIESAGATVAATGFTTTLNTVNENGTAALRHVANLHRLSRFLEMQSFCEKFLRRVSEENSKFFHRSMSMNVDYRLDTGARVTVLDEVLQMLDAFFDTKGEKFSILSPRVFSLTEGGRRRRGERRRILSPSIFPLSDDGVTSDADAANAPLTFGKLLKLTGLRDSVECDEWLALLLEWSGAGARLEKALAQLAPDIAHVEQRVFPAVLEMERVERNWRRVHAVMDAEQREALRRDGYAFLRDEQMRAAYDEKNRKRLRKRDAFVEKLYGQYNSTISRKETGEPAKGAERDPDGSVEDKAKAGAESEAETVGEIEFRVFEPFAFSSIFGHGIVLESLILSPHAFLSQFATPEAGIASVLSPRAFISSVFSPGVLLAHVLSPAAFRAEILSPRALSAFVLTPEAFIAEVLSPKALDTRILSPETLITKILSPEFLLPKVYSPESLGIVVLSPRILSPHIYSGEKYMIEVISPSVLSMSIEAESGEASSHEKHGSHAAGEHAYVVSENETYVQGQHV